MVRFTVTAMKACVTLSMMSIIMVLMILLLNIFAILINGIASDNDSNGGTKSLSDSEIKTLVARNEAEYKLFNETLDSILIPRVPDTPGHQTVQKFITQMMKSLEWTVEEDTFKDSTPHGIRQFTNIITTLNPSFCKRLVLSCHYDSKVNREGTFVGATDSAVPCAMMIHLAQMLDNYLKAHRQNQLLNTTLQFIFFDGEEAFEEWTDTDSLYGSRHLASKWNVINFPSTDADRERCKQFSKINNELDRIEAMILLDLIGSRDPQFYSYFEETDPIFQRFINIEKKLNTLGVIESGLKKSTSYFKSGLQFSYIEDDHVPFIERGVPVVHLIATPFPAVWHLESDNKQNLHQPTINNLLKVLKVFLVEYLHLDVNQIKDNVFAQKRHDLF